MAVPARRNRPYSYQTYGSVAYQPQYDGSAVRAPRRRELEQPVPQPKVQPRRQVRQRPRVEVRQQGAVAPFAIVGFLAVALCSVLLVVSYAQLAVVNDQTVQLRGQLEDLKDTEAALLAQYELTFDLAAIEEMLTSNGTMVKLDPSQISYLDISAPDSIIVYDHSGQGLPGLWQALLSVFAGDPS